MAKGNMLLGMARGSVGDVTFYRDGGLQRARSRNRQPNNPRSNKQQTQRALFSNCVKFYKLTASKFFKFAFENKKVNESDYNAFMRENLKRGVMMSKTAFYVEPYPALGNWLMSRGSLATIRNTNDDNTNAPVFDLGAAYTETLPANITIAQISTAMVASGRYEVGDIITLVKYLANGDNIPTATPSAEGDGLQTNFVFWQFLVDPNNTNTFASIFGELQRFYIVKTTQNTLAIKFGVSAQSGDEEWRLGYTSATIIHSRNTSSGLRVSTQELTINPRMTAAIETAATDANYKSAVLTDWQSSGLAILQGEGLELLDPISYNLTTSKYVVSLHETSDPSSAGDVYNIPFGGVLTSSYGYITAPQLQYDFKSEEMAIRAQTILQAAETPVLRIDGDVVPISNIEVSRIETVVFVELTIAGQQLPEGVSTLQFTCNGIDWASATANVNFT